MTIRFNADEVFEMAEQIEVDGAKFYRAAADKFADMPISKALLDLAKMEDEHKVVFAELRAELPKGETEATIFDPENDVKKYLQAMTEGKVFDKSAAILTGNETIQEILRTAIGLEKDSIIFYLGLRALVPEKLGRSKIDTIIEQEKGHIIILTDNLDELT